MKKTILLLQIIILLSLFFSTRESFSVAPPIETCYTCESYFPPYKICQLSDVWNYDAFTGCRQDAPWNCETYGIRCFPV
jgi:hypothetical protein